MMLVATPAVSVTLVGRSYLAGHVNLEEPDKMFPPLRRTTTMDTSVIVKVCVVFLFLFISDIDGVSVTLVCAYYCLLLDTI